MLRTLNLLASLLLPLPSRLKIISVSNSPEGLLVQVRSVRRRATCPLHSTLSRHFYCHYSCSPAPLTVCRLPNKLLDTPIPIPYNDRRIACVQVCETHPENIRA